jgi:stress response protein YsnF
MTREVFVAIFDSLGAAEAARRDLETTGILSANIRIRSRHLTEATAAPEREEAGFWSRLFGWGSDEDKQYYRDELEQEGRAVLSVEADSADYDRIAVILEGHDLVRTGTEHIEADQSQGTDEGETVLPTAREELEVGKRRVSDTRQYCVRRFVVERPTEERVALHDETVTIERRVPSAAATDSGAFEEKEIEVTETHEEPVVTKRVVPGEDVVVRKEAKDRVETVQGTVRESRVEVDRAAAGNKPAEPIAGGDARGADMPLGGSSTEAGDVSARRPPRR